MSGKRGRREKKVVTGKCEEEGRLRCIVGEEEGKMGMGGEIRGGREGEQKLGRRRKRRENGVMQGRGKRKDFRRRNGANKGSTHTNTCRLPKHMALNE